LDKGGYETWVPAEFANVLTPFDGGLATRQTHLILQNDRLRTLTHTEWERLQGFDDGWTAAMPASHRYQVLGDAMNVNQAEWLGRRLLAVDAALPMIGV
jgi:DNA (cytosine-5)-methyltransferase 1